MRRFGDPWAHAHGWRSSLNDLVVEPEDGTLVRTGVHGQPATDVSLCIEGTCTEQCRKRADQRATFTRRVAYLPSPKWLEQGFGERAIGRGPLKPILNLLKCVKTLPWTRCSSSCMANKCLSHTIWTVGPAGSIAKPSQVLIRASFSR